jgi:TonB-linked SusC/RagA family outer membrane protein
MKIFYKKSMLLFVYFTIIFSSDILFAQSSNISGVVIDEQGQPLIGVNIAVVGEHTFAITDLNGNFSIKTSPTSILKFTYIGFADREEAVNGRSMLKVIMKEDSKLLNEVVIIGYGSMEKRAVTSSITTVKADELNVGVGGATIATALQGKIPGLVISGTSSPNSTNALQLRGIASINASKGPLVVIDGIPGGDIRSLNQEDIESIDVLKDASAGAIYGTRAAGGVILITTKQAKEGKMTVTYTGEVSMETVRKRPEVLTSDEFIEYGLGEDFGSDTDWYSELINNNAISNRHVLSISGGSEAVRLYATLSTQNQKGIVIGDNRKDYSGRINGTFKLFKGKAEIITNAEYREASRDKRNSAGLFNMALWLNPTIPLYDPENPSEYNVQGYGISGTDFNPIADVMLRTNNLKDSWLLSNATLKLNLTNELSIQGTIGYQKAQCQTYSYVDAKHKESISSGYRGSAQHKFSKDENFSAEAFATYNAMIDEKHHLNAVAGYSFWEANGEAFNMENYDFPVNGVGPWDMSSGTYISMGKAGMDSAKDPRERLLSFFGRINYSYLDRYIITTSFRREGSSKFGKNNRWGNFWAISGGWRISEEKIMQNLDFLNDLKLRLGYGITGNNGFGNGYTTRMYKADGSMWPINNSWSYAYGSVRNVNPDLKWEQKAELNIGIDFSFFRNRLYGKFDWYVRNVSDMLYNINAPQPPMVHETIMKNIGNLQNKGWEFELGGDVVQSKNFTYSSVMRLSRNTTRLKNIGLGDSEYIDQVKFPSPGQPGYGARMQNNMEIGQFFVYKHAGIDENGKWLIYDKNNNVVSANNETLVADNKRFIGNAIPKLMLAWEHNLNYKNWDLGISLRSWIDFDIYSQIDMYYGLQTSNQNNVLKSAYTKNKDIHDEKILSDYFLSDGTFLKIDAVTLGYKLDLKKYNKYIDNVRFYLTARDLAVFTKYDGPNPEVNINGLNPGFEYIKDTDSMYPQTMRFTFGTQITF